MLQVCSVGSVLVLVLTTAGARSAGCKIVYSLSFALHSFSQTAVLEDHGLHIAYLLLLL